MHHHHLRLRRHLQIVKKRRALTPCTDPEAFIACGRRRAAQLDVLHARRRAVESRRKLERNQAPAPAAAHYRRATAFVQSSASRNSAAILPHRRGRSRSGFPVAPRSRQATPIAHSSRSSLAALRRHRNRELLSTSSQAAIHFSPTRWRCSAMRAGERHHQLAKPARLKPEAGKILVQQLSV